MSDIEEMKALLQQVAEGSNLAMEQLDAKYGEQIRRVVRAQLPRALRSKFDSLDFVQDVWMSFLAQPLDADRFDTPNGLAMFLNRMARNKVVDVVKQRLMTQKHNVNREVRIVTGPDEPTNLPANHDPTASQWMMAEERWQHLLAEQPPAYQRMLLMLREGHTHAEIAEQLRVSTKLVQRVVKRIWGQQVA